MTMKNFFYALAISLTFVAFYSCNNDEALDDFYPVEFDLTVVNSANENLLDSKNNKDFVFGTTVTYNGKEYNVIDALGDDFVGGNDFYGIKLVGDEKNGQFKIGRWNGNINHQDIAFTINWADGSHDMIAFTNKITYNESGTAVVNRTYTLNGTPFTSHKLTIVK
jgi:hypothetical protein